MGVPATLEQNVKERVKAVIGELIPDELWDKLVRDNIEEFKKVDLPRLVKTELAEKYKVIIQDELNKPEWQSRWDDGQEASSEMVHQLIVKAAPEVLAGMIGLSIQNMMYNLRSQIQQYR